MAGEKPENGDTKPGVGAPDDEIEVTPEMIEAGLHHLLRFGPKCGHSDEDAVERIYRAMVRAKPVR